MIRMKDKDVVDCMDAAIDIFNDILNMAHTDHEKEEAENRLVQSANRLTKLTIEQERK